MTCSAKANATAPEAATAHRTWARRLENSERQGQGFGVSFERLVSQQRRESGFFEVSVVGEGLGDPASLHDEDARAVGQTPALVWSIGIEPSGGAELPSRLRDDLRLRILLQSQHEPERRAAGSLSSARHVVEHLNQQHLGRHNYLVRQLHRHGLGGAMHSVAWPQ